MLSGYGGFGASVLPGFAVQALAWVRAGGVYAFACLRGGGEEGEQWHRAGRRELKHNTFDDLDAAAEHLVAEGWTAPGGLALIGSSNGGLTVAAALTRRPDRYAAVVAVAPLLDMVRYELSGMGPSWSQEYGTAADPGQLAVLHGYSPYHRVRDGVRYPAVLFGVADGDTRVDPLHARKTAAALQAASSGPGPVLLRQEYGLGHGERGIGATVDLLADSLAFLAAHTGLPVDRPSSRTAALLGGNYAGVAADPPDSSRRVACCMQQAAARHPLARPRPNGRLPGVEAVRTTTDAPHSTHQGEPMNRARTLAVSVAVATGLAVLGLPVLAVQAAAADGTPTPAVTAPATPVPTTPAPTTTPVSGGHGHGGILGGDPEDPQDPMDTAWGH
ncbi:prolyl oligopeptidase family serine peptidase [Kitasatospora arboriphila]